MPPLANRAPVGAESKIGIFFRHTLNRKFGTLLGFEKFLFDAVNDLSPGVVEVNAFFKNSPLYFKSIM